MVIGKIRDHRDPLSQNFRGSFSYFRYIPASYFLKSRIAREQYFLARLIYLIGLIGWKDDHMIQVGANLHALF
jgi:hypothetical protein